MKTTCSFKILRHIIPAATCLSVLVLAAPPLTAAEAIFNFNSGIPTEFSTQNSGGLWTLDSDGPTMRISKTSDGGATLPNEFIFGGLDSQFALTGDFFVTVDFNLINLPAAGPNGNALNEAVLSVTGDQNEGFSLLRYTTASSSRLEIYSDAPVGDQPSSLNTGHLRIQRSGDTLIGFVSTPGANNFVSIGSVSGFTSPQFTVHLNAVQGANSGARSTTAMDVEFDNLEIFADGIVAVPEPSSLALAVAGLLSVAYLRKNLKK